MKACQPLQELAASAGQFDLDPAPVAAPGAPSDESRRLASRNQRDDPVLLGLKALGELTHRRPFPPGETPDLEQQQILQGGDALLVRQFLAEAQKTAQLIAKMGEPLEIGFGHVNARLSVPLAHRN